MTRSTRRRLWIGLGVLVLLPLMVQLVTLRQARSSVLRALDAGLGRQVSAAAVRLRLLPWPGVELDTVRMASDPAFGLEDMVIADDAVASVRLRSLLRGRLVFSRLHLDNPSINLVRNRAGQWNIAALLQHVGQPGGGRGGAGASAGASSSSRFPYVDWSGARVNFKLDQFKTRLYLDQVQGSLARESGDWRLQASFQPQRTDLRLSNTGEVRVDGRWRTSASGGFRRAPFALDLVLQNSYLAGSSALLVGHDAGVHGILSARLHVQGTSQSYQIQGTLQAQAVRRWDLLPPPATVNAVLAATYYPSQDRVEVQGLGDPGFRHVRLQGTIQDLFTHPSAVLQLDLRQLGASDLLPLALALKANLPPNLQAVGSADGTLQVQWRRGAAAGHGQITLRDLRLSDDQGQLQWPAAVAVWRGGVLLVAASPARVGALAKPGTAVELGAAADARGFQFEVQAPSFTAADAARLARLVGMASPWPAGLSGTARLRLTLASPWAAFRQASWTGDFSFARARYQPRSGPALRLQPLDLVLGAGGVQRARFALALGAAAAAPTLQGSVAWNGAGGAPAQFVFRAQRLGTEALGPLLAAPVPGLMQRVLGDAAAPAWFSQLDAAGAVAVDDFNWHGIHTALSMTLQGKGGNWSMPSLGLALAGGRFRGTGALRGGQVALQGAVPAAQPLRLAVLLAATPYRGLLSGTLSGSLRLARPLGDIHLGAVAASGVFAAQSGSLATSAGLARFARLSGHYQLRGGAAQLDQLLWVDPDGTRWTGSGTAALGDGGPVGYRFQLQGRAGARRLSGPPPTAAGAPR